MSTAFFRKWLSLALFLLHVVLAREDVSGRYRFDSWTTDNGLPQNGVRSITQSPDGYLWFTTFDGLVRFDGVKFTVFNKANSPGIVNNRFLSVRALADGSVWAATEGGDLTILRNGKFTSYTADQVPENSIYGFELDENGGAVINIDSKLYCLRDGEFVFLRFTEGYGLLKYSLNGRNGVRWEIGLNEAKRMRDGETQSYPLDLKFLNQYVPTAFEDASGGLWISDISRLLYLRDGKVTEYTEKDGVPPDVLAHNFWEEQDGSIWFATGGHNIAGVGLVRFRNGEFTRFGSEHGLSNDRIFSVFRDREDNIWLATDKGLNRLRQQLVTPFSVKNGLIHNEVYPLLKARDGGIYVGTVGGLSRYEGGRFSGIVVRHESEIGSRAVQSLAEDDVGNVWIGVVGGLFMLRDGKLEDQTHLFDSPNTVNAIFTRGIGDLLLGTDRNGLLQYKDGKIVPFLSQADGLADNNVKFIHKAADGTFWIGTYGGISIVECTQPDGRCRVTKNHRASTGLASNSVRSIYEDADGTFWIGTYDGGISRLRGDRFFNFNTGNGLFSDGAFAIVEDRRGRFWITSNQGIFSVEKRDLNAFADGTAATFTTSAYGKQDGMLNTECNGGRQPSSMLDDEGRIWFPTIEGVAVVDPEQRQKNTIPPPVAIETVEVDREKVDLTDQVRIGPAQTQLDIAYTGLSFVKSEQVRFRYKLDDLDQDWIDAGTKRTVSYTHLPPGEYTFTVTAANIDGLWNPEGRSIRIVVLAPFYKTWWFIGLLVFTAGGVGLLVYTYRINELKKRNTAQEAFSRQLIESQEAERKRIAQEIHDGLGQSLLVIKNRASLGLAAREKDKADEQFDEIRDSVSDALSEVRVISQNLRPLHLERLGLSSTLEEMIEQLDEASEIEIDCDIQPIDGLLTPADEINIYRIVQECLNNVVKHSQAQRASVSAYIEDQQMFLIVKDNGRGIGKDETGRHRGMGLSGIAERAKILGGLLSIDSVTGAGTTVSLIVPLAKP